MVRVIQLIRIMEFTARVIRFFTPWVVRTFMFILGIMTTGVITFWGNIPQMVRRIADEWLDRAVLSGFPTQWDRHLYYVLSALAYLMLVFGWIFLSYSTVWFVGLLF